MGVSQGILGLTVLAWANSLGDLIANSTVGFECCVGPQSLPYPLRFFGQVARHGFSQMGIPRCMCACSVADVCCVRALAVGACFGGPLLNLLFGLGMGCTYRIASQKSAIHIGLTTEITVGLGFFLLSLLSSITFIPARGFWLQRYYGVYLMIMYTCFLITSVVLEVRK